MPLCDFLQQLDDRDQHIFMFYCFAYFVVLCLVPYYHILHTLVRILYNVYCYNILLYFILLYFIYYYTSILLYYTLILYNVLYIIYAVVHATVRLINLSINQLSGGVASVSLAIWILGACGVAICVGKPVCVWALDSVDQFKSFDQSINQKMKKLRDVWRNEWKNELIFFY